MTKRVLAALLALMFIFVTACGPKTGSDKDDQGQTAQTDDAEQPAQDDEYDGPKADEDTLVVGASDLNGDYINGFTNSTYDVWVKRLIGNYGAFYATYVADEDGEFVLDETTNAKEPEITENEDGSKTYRFFLNPELVWNDGEPITAKDYVFDVLFSASPQWLEAGANSSAGNSLKGYQEYHDGAAKTFEGIKYIDEHTFELTIAKEKLPYFFEESFVAAGPTPMHRFSPNLDIGEDGSSLVVKEGYEVTDKDKKDLVERIDAQIKTLNDQLEETLKELEAYKNDESITEEEYNEEVQSEKENNEKEVQELEAKKQEVDTSSDLDALLLLNNAFEVAQNYRYNPDVTCGPYNFVEFKNQAAVVTLNDKFLGDFKGRKPTIKNVVVRRINQKLGTDLAISGDIDINAGVIEGEQIEKAKASDKVGTTNYPRNGFGMIRFLTDLGTTQYKEVRQAVAYLMDRNIFVQNILGGYGKVVDGSYGLAEWTYKDRAEEIEEKLTHYTLNIEKANELLDQTPYKFEKDGTTPWSFEKAQEAYKSNQEGFDYWRYNDKGEELVINHYATKDNDVSDTIASEIPNNGKQVGLNYHVQYGDFATLLTLLKNPDLDNPKFTAFNLATGFAIPNDPYYSNHSSQIGIDNQDRINDPKADELTEKLRQTKADDREGYLNTWVEFQQWWNDYMPQIPLYSNDYYDIYNVRVEGLETTPTWDWSNDIVNLTLTK